MSIATTIHKDISPRIDLQIPEHVRADHPAFVAFLKAYYEYMGQDSNAIAAARRLPNDLDIDHSLDSFLTFYLKEFIPQIPKDALVDKKLLIRININLRIIIFIGNPYLRLKKSFIIYNI